MPDSTPEGGSGFTDREMRLIFERAGEISAQEGGERRYSLAEIQDIASQAGLDPAAIGKAAATIRAVPLAKDGLLGAPTRFSESRVVDAKLGDNEINAVVVKIREATGLHGELRVVPGGVEWRARHGLGMTIVDFTPQKNGTRVDLLLAREDAAAAVSVAGLAAGFGAAVATAIVALSFDVGPAVGVGAAALAGAGTAWASARLIWARVARHWVRKTSDVMQTIVDAAQTPPGD